MRRVPLVPGMALLQAAQHAADSPKRGILWPADVLFRLIFYPETQTF
jgi:hypothetical protein